MCVPTTGLQTTGMQTRGMQTAGRGSPSASTLPRSAPDVALAVRGVPAGTGTTLSPT